MRSRAKADDGPPAAERARHRVCEVDPPRLVVVPAVAVGRLHEQNVSAGEGLRRTQQRVSRAAEVAADTEGVPVLQGQMRPGRTQDVPGRVQCEPGTRAQVGLRSGRHRPKEFQGPVDVGFVVQRLSRVVFGPAVLVGVPGRFRLNLGAVTQHDLHEPGRELGRDHLSSKAVAHQPGQVPAMIQMRVSDDDRFDVLRVARQAAPIPSAEVRDALEQAAVHEDPGVVALDQELAPRDGSHASEEREQCRTLSRGRQVPGPRGGGVHDAGLLGARPPVAPGWGPVGPRVLAVLVVCGMAEAQRSSEGPRIAQSESSRNGRGPSRRAGPWPVGPPALDLPGGGGGDSRLPCGRALVDSDSRLGRPGRVGLRQRGPKHLCRARF